MDGLFFDRELEFCRVIPETTHYLQVLNYSDTGLNISELHSLSSDDFNNFLTRKGVFEPPKPKEGISFISGIRLIVHKVAENPDTFSPRVISLPRDRYRSLVREWHLPTRAIETSAVVGPFFWYDFEEGTGDKHLQLLSVAEEYSEIIFRKSDVKWGKSSRGWEMTLSYSFETRITSGYVKGAENANMTTLISQVQQCASCAGHPLLLPVFQLSREISFDNDKAQRDSRDKVRDLEGKLLNRYHNSSGPKTEDDKGPPLENIIHQLHNHQCKVLWKRPQAWKNVVNRMLEANGTFWEGLTVEQKEHPTMQKIHPVISSRLRFLEAKLAGLESYTQVTLERMDLLRELMNNIIAQAESKHSLQIAMNERILADASRRDSISMKTLALLGATFLPGTFLSSLFSMTFFNFRQDIWHDTVSSQLWIYFVVMIPLTGMVLGGWWKYNQVSVKSVERARADVEAQGSTAQDIVLQEVRRRTTFGTA